MFMAVSNSWGQTDNSDFTSFDHFFDHPGVPQIIANGDNGTVTGNNNYPSALPNVVSVSGTTLNLDGTGSRTSETVWGDGTGNNGASGGGCSVYAAPAWQSSLPNWASAGCGASAQKVISQPMPTRVLV